MIGTEKFLHNRLLFFIIIPKRSRYGSGKLWNLHLLITSDLPRRNVSHERICHLQLCERIFDIVRDIRMVRNHRIASKAVERRKCRLCVVDDDIGE
jgi:hypothetical protein